MKFLIAFAAVLGYASASLLAPLAYANAGDVQAAHIDAAVAAQDHTRAAVEGQARFAEAVNLQNTEAVRQVAETNRDLHEASYWNSVAASQNYVAAAQSQAAAIDGQAAAVRASWAAGPAVWAGAAPLAYAGHGLGYAGHGLGYAGHGLGYAGLGYRAW